MQLFRRSIQRAKRRGKPAFSVPTRNDSSRGQDPHPGRRKYQLCNQTATFQTCARDDESIKAHQQLVSRSLHPRGASEERETSGYNGSCSNGEMLFQVHLGAARWFLFLDAGHLNGTWKVVGLLACGDHQPASSSEAGSRAAASVQRWRILFTIG